MSIDGVYQPILSDSPKKRRSRSAEMENSSFGFGRSILLALILSICILNFITLRSIGKNIIPADLSDSAKELRRISLLTIDEDRKALLNSSTYMDNPDFYRRVKPEAYCREKVRIGEKGDGGKYVCNPTKVKNDCTLLSLGLNNQIGYDKHIFKATGGVCKIFGADKSTQNENTVASYFEMNNGRLFVGMLPENLTIPSMMEAGNRKEVDFLKIDIEGGEFTALEPLIKQYFVCQIFIEIHGSPAAHLEMLKVMSKYGFRIFNVDPNPYCVNCCEYSLINELCMSQYGVVPLGVIIPQ